MSDPSLHMLKLSVGTESVEHLARHVEQRWKQGTRFHTTRMVPKQREALLAGGSIYWVIKGQIQARQKLRDIEVVTGGDGIRRCRLHLDRKLIATRWQPKRPFQGWRYLKSHDAPGDLMEGEAALPAELQVELSDLGLL